MSDATPAESFDDLVRRAQSGDREAVERLFEGVRPLMMRIAREHADPTRADASVSDLVQEAELRAWQRLEQFRGAGAAASDEEARRVFEGWIGQLVRRVALNVHEAQTRKRRHPEGQRIARIHAADSEGGPGGIDPPAAQPSPSANVRLDEQARIVQEAVERLDDPVAREVIKLHVFEELSFPEVARRLDLTYDQVRERYHAALRTLEWRLRRHQ